MNDALKESDRTIAVLSPSYLEATYPSPEWAAAFSEDPEGLEPKLVPVKVQGCTPKGLLKAIVHIDLVGHDEETARERLLEGVIASRAKPDHPPIYPGAPETPSPEQPRPFPPSALDASLRSARDTWGERDRLEIYVIANLSVGRTPHDMPIDRDPQLTRLRLLKDAIRDGQLLATLEGEKPNAWATVTPGELRKFAEKKRHSDLLAVVERWTALHKGDEDKPSIQEVRLRLAALRTAGVQLRNGGRNLEGIAQVGVSPGSGHSLGPVYLGSFGNRVAGTPLIGPRVQEVEWVPSRVPGCIFPSLVSRAHGPGKRVTGPRDPGHGTWARASRQVTLYGPQRVTESHLDVLESRGLGNRTFASVSL
jgi:hypothetical protein